MKNQIKKTIKLHEESNKTILGIDFFLFNIKILMQIIYARFLKEKSTNN
jgi:hypothetical protein